MPGVDKNVLLAILKTYAFYNPEIEYCQGMNYVAGFLLQVFKDEELAFKALQSLAAKQNMASLFNSDLPRLKLYFLQLDRLLAIVDIDLYNHFSDENLSSSYYSSAWFITLFTNQLKHNMDPDTGVVNESLLQLWDYFLVSGWQAVLKMGLFLLTMDSTQLMQMSFEDLLFYISESPKKVFVQARAG